jgi:hypothetical protein
MRLMMVLAPSDCLSDVQNLLDDYEIHAYTEIPSVLGAGESGRKMGTRAFPGTTSMILAIVGEDEGERLVAAVRGYGEERRCCHELRIFALPAERVF